MFAILTAILSAALLGAYFTKVEYPYFMAIASIELFGFRRFDVLIAYLWFAVAIVRAALFFFSAAHLTDSLFRTPRRKRVFWLLTVCFAASALGIGCSIEVFSGISLFIRSAPVAILFAAVVPGVLLLSRKKGRGKTLEM